jgi:glucose/arabinose dehydrogenase
MDRKILTSALAGIGAMTILAGCASSQQPVQDDSAVTQPSAQAHPAAGPTASPGEEPASTDTLAPTAPVNTPEPPPTPTPVDPAALQVLLEVSGEGFKAPVGFAHAGDGSGRLFVVEKEGAIRILLDGMRVETPFLDIRERVGAGSSEQGLLGLAFAPDYAVTGFFFVNYTDRNGDTIVSRFRVTADPDLADPASEEVVLRVDQPAGNHNGGHLAFGPDGYLYIGLGDGGGAGDIYGNGQNTHTLLGAMLRLDVSELPYRIPADNPFAGNPDVLDEIWAYGLRNPWLYSFDRLTGDLYIADVGQNAYEEINVQPASSAGGENYGWPIMEGLHCFLTPGGCDQTGLTLPVAEYSHASGCSVTGGYVYRGASYPALYGVYIFGDFCSGHIWGLAARPDGSWLADELAQASISLSAFGEGEDGELYLADMNGGIIYHLVLQ